MSESLVLKGIVPPICTPFTEENELDIPSLKRLIEWQLDAGVHGLFMLGSTSETATLTSSQRGFESQSELSPREPVDASAT